MDPVNCDTKRSTRRLTPVSLRWMLSMLTLWLGCGSPATLGPGEETTRELDAAAEREFSARVAAFSAERAWRDLQELTEVGARSVGSRGNARARKYLRGELEALGVEVEAWEVDLAQAKHIGSEAGETQLRVTNLSAVVPGTRSQDRFVLIAPFDSQAHDDFEFIGANDGASGAAVVLEIARAIAADPLPYATEFVFLDGESSFRATPGGPIYRRVGSWGLASRLQREGVRGVRAVVYLNQVGDADLQIARDLMSYRVYREEFWKAAAALDRTHAFPRDAEYQNVGVSNQAFAQIGLRQVVSLVDPSFGGDQPPGLYAGTEQDTIERCSAESLETVGVVVLEALDVISGRLARIDHFAGSRTRDDAAH